MAGPQTAEPAVMDVSCFAAFGPVAATSCRLLALSGHSDLHRTCPLFGGKADIAGVFKVSE